MTFQLHAAMSAISTKGPCPGSNQRQPVTQLPDAQPWERYNKCICCMYCITVYFILILYAISCILLPLCCILIYITVYSYTDRIHTNTKTDTCECAHTYRFTNYSRLQYIHIIISISTHILLTYAHRTSTVHACLY